MRARPALSPSLVATAVAASPGARDVALPASVDPRPEARLLLACARSSIDAETARRIRELVAADLDWNFVLRRAQQNYLAPLVCAHLTTVCPELLPSTVLAFLRSVSLVLAAGNLRATGELLRILALLESAGVEAMPFKGPLLAARAYGNLALRMFGDLDVLVHEEDVEQAVRVISANGYALEGPASREHAKDVTLTSADNRTRIELHWRLSREYFSFALDERQNARRMWEGLETAELSGRHVRTLPPTDLLIYLCSHGSKHRWERLEWIVDVAEVLRSTPQLDWNETTLRARALGCERVFALGLRLAHELLGAELPEAIRREVVADVHVRPAFDAACASLFADREPFAHSVEKHLYRHHLQERWRDRVRLGLVYSRAHVRSAFRPSEKDRAFLPLPAWLSFLYVAVRPVRFGVDYVAARLGRAAKRRSPDASRPTRGADES